MVALIRSVEINPKFGRSSSRVFPYLCSNQVFFASNVVRQILAMTWTMLGIGWNTPSISPYASSAMSSNSS
jgi:hypothetical protein